MHFCEARSWKLLWIKASAKYINVNIDNSVLRTLWQHFGEGPFLFWLDCAPMHKVSSIEKCFVEFGVKKLDWPA